MYTHISIFQNYDILSDFFVRLLNFISFAAVNRPNRSSYTKSELAYG